MTAEENLNVRHGPFGSVERNGIDIEPCSGRRAADLAARWRSVQAPSDLAGRVLSASAVIGY